MYFTCDLLKKGMNNASNIIKHAMFNQWDT